MVGDVQSNDIENYELNKSEMLFNNKNGNDLSKDKNKDNAHGQITLIGPLSHFAVYRNQKQEHLTYLRS